MKHETEHAVYFWSSKLNPNLPEWAISRFEEVMFERLCNKFALHWYSDQPIRGQAYREVAFDPEMGYVDEILEIAANAAGFRFSEQIDRIGYRMWVDPGEVAVSLTRSPHRTQAIYPPQPKHQRTNPGSGTVYYNQPRQGSTSPVYHQETVFLNDSSNDYKNQCSVPPHVYNPSYPVNFDIPTR